MAAVTGMPAFPSSADRTRISRHSRTQSEVFPRRAEQCPVQEHSTYTALSVAAGPSAVRASRWTAALNTSDPDSGTK